MNISYVYLNSDGSLWPLEPPGSALEPLGDLAVSSLLHQAYLSAINQLHIAPN